MKKGWKIFWHTLFWVSIISFFVFIAHSERISMRALLIIFLGFGIINIALFYLNYLLLIPWYLDKKKYRQYAGVLVLTIIVFGLVKYGLASVFWTEMHPTVKGQKMPHEALKFGWYFTQTCFTSILFLFLSTVLQFSLDWFTNERVQRDLENQRLTAELAFLKSQINPHFLFNSLNSIYSLAYQKSETTPEAILKLSEIMRYMLYECNDNKVDLAKELTYLQNYIDLQKIRFGKKAYVDFEVNGQVTNQRIVPLLLIAFIENAFKHGVANDPKHPIKLIINLDDGHLSFYMENRKHVHNRDSSGGIGLSNVKRRLDLLYPNAYKLEIHDDADIYTCELSLIL
ncbi:sensor histidine kinase [Mucilaginibacter boryungensis]|uniref:Sensor histidine kinase n=1 Tax=Mucilaginibacter boryungensis TaxID=768480 RepID=A0ABR9XCQ7_9SPHI|nr:sensor histidine kinase [Mucilaginibacter boryungensis]MBE9664858.1 sensor histidine kinase [Mucilaginibacter boryungensis]